MIENILRIGHVIQVDGGITIGELEASIDNLYRTYKSKKYAIGQIGSIVKIESGDLLIFGVVTSLRMKELEEGKQQDEEPSSKWIEIELFGEGHRTGLNEADFEFERGVSTYPLPGHPIYLATVNELERIYSKPDKPTVRAGVVSQARSLPVHLLIDELIGKHFAVLGTTGSGKSCAVTLLLQGIINEYKYAHIILLDPHNEYLNAFPDTAEKIDPTSLEIPHWMLNFEESISLFVGKTEFAATSQTNILQDAIIKAKRDFKPLSVDTNIITVDTPIPYKIGDLESNIEESKQLHTTKAAQEPYSKILAKIVALKNDKRFGFLIRSDNQVKDNLKDILSNIFRMPVGAKPLAIIDLSGVPSDVVDVVVSVLCRTIFDFALWNKKSREMPLLLVCEEAHRYVPKSDEAAFQPTKRAISRIAKEGRKYGVGLALISQRPSELSESIISQCNTVIALRMSNEQDQNFVKRALPDSVQSLASALPTLRSKEALVVGEGTAVPVRLLFDEIPENRRPKSANVPFAASWSIDVADASDVEETIKHWREQIREK